MPDKRIPLEPIDQLSLENLMLKEEILKRDWAKINDQKAALTSSLAKKYGINTEKETFSVDMTSITVKDK
jgi:hypothetical protein